MCARAEADLWGRGGAWPDNEPTRRATDQRPSPTGVEGAEGTGGHTYQAPPDWRPPRGLRGLAGLRDDAPSEARGADGERAGRPRGGRKSGGGQARRCPEHQQHHVVEMGESNPRPKA